MLLPYYKNAIKIKVKQAIHIQERPQQMRNLGTWQVDGETANGLAKVKKKMKKKEIPRTVGSNTKRVENAYGEV